MLKNVLCPMMASAALLLGGCGASAFSDSDHSSGESSLKGVYDAEYYLQLRPEGDLGAYKFEICLMGSLNNQENLAGDCVGALKTNTGDDLLLTIKDLSELSLTESEKIALLKNREEYLVYEQSLKRRGSDAVTAVGLSTGIVIGGGAATVASQQITGGMADRAVKIAAEALEVKEELIRKAGKKASGSESMIANINALLMDFEEMDGLLLDKLTAEADDILDTYKSINGLLDKVTADLIALDSLKQRKAEAVGKLESLLNEDAMESLIRKAENNIANLEGQMSIVTKSIDQNLKKVNGNVDVLKVVVGSKKLQEATKLVDKADKMVRWAKQARKFNPPALMLATAAAVFGVGYVFAKDHVAAYADVQGVLVEHNELSTLLSYGSPLLSVADNFNESVSSVETVLLNFAKWQALVSSYSSDSSVVVDKICLPKASSAEGGVTEADCHTLDM